MRHCSNIVQAKSGTDQEDLCKRKHIEEKHVQTYQAIKYKEGKLNVHAAGIYIQSDPVVHVSDRHPQPDLSQHEICQLQMFMKSWIINLM